MLSSLLFLALGSVQVSAQVNFTVEERAAKHALLNTTKTYFFNSEDDMNFYGESFNGNISDARAVSAAKNIKLIDKVAYVNQTIVNLRYWRDKQSAILNRIKRDLNTVLGATSWAQVLATIEANRNEVDAERVPVGELFAPNCTELQLTYLDPTLLYYRSHHHARFEYTIWIVNRLQNLLYRKWFLIQRVTGIRNKLMKEL
jgi:hypothetical protein